MPLLAILLLLVSAALHALWNLLLKGSDEKYVAMGWQVVIGGILSLIALFFTGLPPRSMWLFALASGALEAIYFVLLSYAYSGHDFSLVYPMARGMRFSITRPPVFDWYSPCSTKSAMSRSRAESI